ncbi:MAG: cytochrome c maturation protein CcmE [Ignavibacteriota bacterium]
MKKKHIIALSVAVLFIAIAAFALVDNKIDYSDFKTARNSGKRVQVSGEWEKGLPTTYDESQRLFTFSMKDHKGVVMPVRYIGIKPNNFEIAPQVVCVGKVEGGVFQVTDIQTKCPSRYEGSAPKS